MNMDCIMDCVKLLSASNWTTGGCRELSHICAILLITLESLWMIWIIITELDFMAIVGYLFGLSDKFIEEFEFEELEIPQHDEAFRFDNIILLSIFGIIISVFTNWYALKLAMSFKVADKRCLYLFVLRVFQIVYSVWLRYRNEAMSELMARILGQLLLWWLSSKNWIWWLWGGSLLIFLGVIDWMQGTQLSQTEIEEMFKYCHQGKKEKLKQFVIRHSDAINRETINTKHKGNTILHFAIDGNHLHIVKYLLQTFGEALDLSVKNEDGLIQLDLAIKKKYSNIANTFLSEKCADPDLSSLILAVKTDQDKLARRISQIRCEKRLSSK